MKLNEVIGNYPLTKGILSEADHCMQWIHLFNFILHQDNWKEDNLYDLLEVQRMVAKIYPVRAKTIYRGTTISNQHLPTIMADKPFTLKGSRPVRSWTVEMSVAEMFFGDEGDDQTVGLVVQSTSSPQDTIVDFSDARVILDLKNLKKVLRKGEGNGYMDYPDIGTDVLGSLLHAVWDSMGNLEKEKEIVRLVEEDVSYVLCDSIVKLKVYPYLDHDVSKADPGEVIKHLQRDKIYGSLMQRLDVYDQEEVAETAMRSSLSQPTASVIGCQGGKLKWMEEV